MFNKDQGSTIPRSTAKPFIVGETENKSAKNQNDKVLANVAAERSPLDQLNIH